MEEVLMDDVEGLEPIPLYATCTHCGRQLGQYFPPCRKHTTTCPQCGAKLAIAAHNGQIIINIIATKGERQKQAALSR